MQNLERKWYNRESTGERWKLNKERECKQKAPVLQCKQSLCKVKSTEQNGGLIKSKCMSFIFKTRAIDLGSSRIQDFESPNEKVQEVIRAILLMVNESGLCCGTRFYGCRKKCSGNYSIKKKPNLNYSFGIRRGFAIAKQWS
ncbi:uncharacterized [Tachysurus ichikawai]